MLKIMYVCVLFRQYCILSLVNVCIYVHAYIVRIKYAYHFIDSDKPAIPLFSNEVEKALKVYVFYVQMYVCMYVCMYV